jgi:type I restriction enzyme M protein
MSGKITQSELESYLWDAAVLLRGFIDAGDYKQFIFPLLFFKRLCDVYDEETASAERVRGVAYKEDHRLELVISEGAHWKDVRQQATNVGIAIQNAMRTISADNPELYGIFGDAPWTNKERLSDSTLRDLIEHFSSQTLSLERVSDDLLGKGYEYLIKKFADDSGHTAAEFYTNRTVVQLMTRLLEPQPSESVYDPTCGSGGMLLEAAMELRNQGREYRNLRLYGQEINLMTSAMARMNLFMHGFEDFEIVRGDTLSFPAFIQDDELRQFDIILANPPYSIKQWDRDAWSTDRYDRNFLGVPPQGRADYAFLQHILKSLKPASGRTAVLFPHGILFRQEEQSMRQKLLEEYDLVECVIGLGPNLFYNSPMEACILICRRNKDSKRQNHVLFINAVDRVTRHQAQSFLDDDHIAEIVQAYRDFADVEGFSRVVPVADILDNNASLSIPLYIRTSNGEDVDTRPLKTVIKEWQDHSQVLRASMDDLFSQLEPCEQPHTNNHLPEQVVLGEMRKLAEQMSGLASLYQTSNQQLSATLAAAVGPLSDLHAIAFPTQKLLDQMVVTIPKIDTTAITGMAAAQIPDISPLLETMSPRLDMSGLLGITALATPQSAIQESMAKLTTVFTSNAFSMMQTSLGVSASVELTVSNFLDSLAIDQGTELRALTGGSEKTDLAIDVLTDDLPIEALPEDFRKDVDELREFVYDNSIAITAMLLWAVNCLWILHSQDFESASNLAATLLTILILLKEMSDKDQNNE